jgi:hypothetical protein
MFKVLKELDTTNKELVEKTIKELWALQDIHIDQLEEAWFTSGSEEEAIEKRDEIKETMKNVDHDLDILCGIAYGKLG